MLNQPFALCASSQVLNVKPSSQQCSLFKLLRYSSVSNDLLRHQQSALLRAQKKVILICVLVENLVVLTNLTYVFFTSWLQRGHLRHHGFCFRFCGSVSFDRLLTWLSSALYLKLLFLSLLMLWSLGCFLVVPHPPSIFFFFCALNLVFFYLSLSFYPSGPKVTRFFLLLFFFLTPLLVFILIFVSFLFFFSLFL